MNRPLFAFSLIIAAISPLAFAQSGTVQYISDDIAISMRDAPRNDAAVIGSVRSGQKLVVLETLGADSFARVRTGDGREGWLTARYLTSQPAAKDRAAQIKAELDNAQAQIKALQNELKDAKAQLDKARPALELSGDNEKLKAELAAKEQAAADLMQRYDQEKARRATLLTGAGLAGGGVILGLALPWLLQLRRRRRWGDF